MITPFTFQDRKELLKELFKKLDEMLVQKGREYAQGDQDTLRNFSSRADWLGVPRKAVLFTDLSKHLDAIKGWAMHDAPLTVENADNRMVDSLVYLVLLIGLYRQEHD